MSAFSAFEIKRRARWFLPPRKHDFAHYFALLARPEHLIDWKNAHSEAPAGQLCRLAPPGQKVVGKPIFDTPKEVAATVPRRPGGAARGASFQQR
jgi:hypothetical protein